MLRYDISKLTKKVFFIIISTVFLIACDQTDSPQKESIFRFNIHTGFTSMDPAFSRNQSNIWVCDQLYNGLLKLDHKLNIVPDLAKKWNVDSSGTLYTFTLKQNLYFHEHPFFLNKEDRKVRAHDFVASFNRILDPETASPGSWIFNGIVSQKDAFQAINDSTVQIKLQKSFPPFAGILCMKYCSVLPKKLLDNPDYELRKEPVGTGPFTFGSYFPEEKLILYRNSEYHQKNQGDIKAIEISFIPGKQNEFLAFRQGQLDWISGLDKSFKDKILEREGVLKTQFQNDFQFSKISFLNLEYLGILIGSKGADECQYQQVRLALNYAIDREKLLAYLRNGIGKAAVGGPVPPSLKKYSLPDSLIYSYNPERARKMLEKSDLDPNSINITLQTNPNYLDLSLFIKKQIEEIGISVEIEVLQSSFLRQLMQKGESQFFRASWIADYPDPENYLTLFYSKNKAPNGPNYTHYSNALFDSLYEASLKEADLEKRNTIYAQLEAIIQTDAPIIPLYYDEVVWLFSNKWKMPQEHPLNLIDLWSLKMQRDQQN